MPAEAPRFLLLGEILRPHGVRGELRMRLLTDYPERIPQLEKVFLSRDPDAENPAAHQVEHLRMNQGYGLLKLVGVDDRDEADAFRECFVMVDFQNAIPLDEGEFYLYQLIGVRVETENGEAIGSITEVLETGANDVYVVDSPTYGEVLIPVTDQTIVKTDIDAGLVVVRLPDGLLPPPK
jgi:16S rRNA processing protein RimM